MIPAEVLEHDCGVGSAWRFARAGETAIDLGCGSGKGCFLLARAVGPAGRVVGVDASPAMIAVARSIARPNLELLERRIEDLGDVLPDACADLAALDCVLTFVPERDRGAILAAARRIVRPGGRLIVADVLARGLEGFPERLERNGFEAVEVVERSEEVLRVVGGVPRHATTLRALRSG